MEREPIAWTGGTTLGDVDLQKFTMVPVETLKPGDVVAPFATPVRFASPVAEVNLRDHGVELVFIEKSLVGDHGVRGHGRTRTSIRAL